MKEAGLQSQGKVNSLGQRLWGKLPEKALQQYFSPPTPSQHLIGPIRETKAKEPTMANYSRVTAGPATQSSPCFC